MKGTLKAVAIEPRHLGQIDHLHDVQQRVIKMPVDRPLVLKEPVLCAVGMEDERGKLKGGFYAEAIAELCFLGICPGATDAAIEIAPEVYDFLKSRGIRWLRCFIPTSMKDELGPKFEAAGFSCQDEKVSHYAVDLREK